MAENPLKKWRLLLKMDSIKEYLSTSIEEVYDLIGNRGMRFYYVPYIEHKFVDSQDYLDYDFEGRIPLKATLNSNLASDADLEYAHQYLKNTRNSGTIQFTLRSIYPNMVRPLDRIYVEYADGRTEDYLIVGIDDGVLLQGVYISVRVFQFDGTLTNFQWANNGVASEEFLY